MKTTSRGGCFHFRLTLELAQLYTRLVIVSSLTNKQRIFIDEYLKCWNATEAARRAGYAGDSNTLAVVGYENLRKPNIADRISKRLQETTMSADEALTRLSEMARGEWGKYVTEQGDLDIIQLVQDGKGYLVKKVKETKDGKEFEFYDAQRALVDIARAHGVFVERHDVTSGGDKIIFQIGNSIDLDKDI